MSLNKSLSKNFKPEEMQILREMLLKRIQSPRTTSMGRCFDAVACLLGLETHNHYEGQAACLLEYEALKGKTPARISRNFGTRKESCRYSSKALGRSPPWAT